MKVLSSMRSRKSCSPLLNLLKPIDHLNLPQPGQLILLIAHGRATRLPPPSLHQGPGHTDGCRKGETLVERQFAASSITDSLGSTAQGRALSMLIDTEGPDRSRMREPSFSHEECSHAGQSCDQELDGL